MTLDPGLEPLTGPWQVVLDDLGGPDPVDLSAIGIVSIDGLEDVPEIDGDDVETAGDSDHLGNLRLTSRELTITVTPRPNEVVDWDAGDWSDWAQATAEEIKAAVAPGPDRSRLRMLRFVLPGMAAARRLYYRPATGKPLRIATNVAGITLARKEIVIRLDCPDPVVVSDEHTDVVFEPGETIDVVNAGTFTALMPCAWSLTAGGPVTLEHLDFPGESIRLPAGPVTVSRSREVAGPGGSAVVESADPNLWIPRWPLLRPGSNRLKASAACTLRKWDTWP